MRKIIFPTHFFLPSRPTGRQKWANKGQCGRVITDACNGRLSLAREIPTADQETQNFASLHNERIKHQRFVFIELTLL